MNLALTTSPNSTYKVSLNSVEQLLEQPCEGPHTCPGVRSGRDIIEHIMQFLTMEYYSAQELSPKNQ